MNIALLAIGGVLFTSWIIVKPYDILTGYMFLLTGAIFLSLGIIVEEEYGITLEYSTVKDVRKVSQVD